MATSSLLRFFLPPPLFPVPAMASTSTTSTPLVAALACITLEDPDEEATGGEDTVAKELGGKTNPRLMSESVRSASLLLIWFFFELLRDNKDNPKEAKLEELLSLLSVRLNCF